MALVPGDIHKLFDTIVEQNASDLHITVGRPPVLRMKGRLRNLQIPALTNEDCHALISEIIPAGKKEEFDAVGSADFGHAHGEKARFRVAVFKQKGNAAMVCRLIPNKLLTFEQIGLPHKVVELLDRPRGLLLVTGPTGSGKTTTLATMVDYINQNAEHHIITIEDPIEYFHDHKRCIVNQREVGTDVTSFAEAIRRALREDPDVILLGEMRDLETIATAITAAETGHLVFGTLHTTGSARTVDRIIDQFPPEQQEQVRVQLSVSLIGVISQVLMPKKDGSGVVAAFETMVMTPGIENHIRKNETFKIPSAIQTGRQMGMFLLDDHLWDLYQAGTIDAPQMLSKCQNPRAMRERLGGDI
ncbi:MAG: type IV pilus twitching motility protein PilT [Planctomycetes bacterium]|nr:type IV pilus twitching motility protein PilT [Planctomycetota bacterium]MCB9826545.1 type IV pilus twitching motility protein PilT [Planctomycetota bacterium]MCB9829782.1 type IV pilus twitching motility protein PilT [Planctomycetota bacterium]MCB9902266.1 type IV pilus twitching motility protein PilT [Planctomycetota bacterium]